MQSRGAPATYVTHTTANKKYASHILNLRIPQFIQLSRCATASLTRLSYRDLL